MKVSRPNVAQQLATHLADLLSSPTLGGTITFLNAGEGDDAVFTMDSEFPLLALSSALFCNSALAWKGSGGGQIMFDYEGASDYIITFPGENGTVSLISRTEILGGKTLFEALISQGMTFNNQGGGSTVKLDCNSAAQTLRAAGNLEATLDFLLKSGTAYDASFAHANSAARIYTFQNKAGTIADLADISTHAALTATHGVGGTIADVQDITNHAALTQTHGVPGEICDWSQANPAVTRYFALGARHFCYLMQDSGALDWVFDPVQIWADTATLGNYFIPIHLPHGATITSFLIRGQETGSAVLTASLQRAARSGGAINTIATLAFTSSMADQEDTSIQSAVVDNDAYEYSIYVNLTTSAEECRLEGARIAYTVDLPHP